MREEHPIFRKWLAAELTRRGFTSKAEVQRRCQAEGYRFGRTAFTRIINGERSWLYMFEIKILSRATGIPVEEICRKAIEAGIQTM